MANLEETDSCGINGKEFSDFHDVVVVSSLKKSLIETFTTCPTASLSGRGESGRRERGRKQESRQRHMNGKLVQRQHSHRQRDLHHQWNGFHSYSGSSGLLAYTCRRHSLTRARGDLARPAHH
ncbi:hypothetical protein J6590_050099 [Homalodisca vitripennis]|nr:hypothetical protein J6590_050099 [Homalodisca vitripennis]